jgi:mono/diheme cytochrome c family protein
VTLAETGGGSYLITVVGGAAQAAIPNRYLFRVADSAAGEDIGETRVYLYGDFPASPVDTPVVSAAACQNCHGPEGIHIHGGYFAMDQGAEPCLACHGRRALPSLSRRRS